MSNRTQKWIVAAAAALLWLCGSAYAADKHFDFYNGPGVISRVTGTIDLRRDEPAVAEFKVEILNTSKHPLVDLLVGFRGSQDASGTVTVRGKHPMAVPTPLKPAQEYAKDPESHVRQVSLDLLLLLNGRVPNKPIVDTDVLILLPEAVPALIRSSMPLVTPGLQAAGHGSQPKRHGYEKKLSPQYAGHAPATRRALGYGTVEDQMLPEPGKVNGRAAYRLLQHNMYLTELNLVYTDGSVTLSMKKTLAPTPIGAANQVETVTLQICNQGPAPATNVVLRDSFDPRDFAAYTGPGAVGTLQLVPPAVGPATGPDQRLVWTTTIPGPVPMCPSTLPAVLYYVSSNAPVRGCWLNAATATMGGTVVGVSNKIPIP